MINDHRIELPFNAKCNACGKRWVQTEPWAEGDLLFCAACGGIAVMDDYDREEPEPDVEPVRR